MTLLEVLVLHAVVTAYMVGVILVVQVVHYPLFSWVERSRYRDFQEEHMRRITWVVGLPMLLEAALATGLVLAAPQQVSRELAIVGLLLLAVVWLSTALQQVPAHTRLSRGFDSTAHARLLKSNRVRTMAWMGRLVVAWVMVSQGLA